MDYSSTVTRDITDYYYGPLGEWDRQTQKPPASWTSRAFAATPEIDADIRQRFAPLLAEYDKGELDHLKSNIEGQHALVILLDQFTRNIFRGTGKAFSYDAGALAISLKAIESGEVKKLRIFEQWTMGMPLMHSEDLEVQHRSIEYFRAMVKQSEALSEDLQGFFKQGVGYAESHKGTIERFGRYPHRNKYLGRESTAEELEFLKDAPQWAK